MSYNYTLEELLVLLHATSATRADAVTVSRRRVEHGLLSVGLKIHCLNDGDGFTALIDALGGAGNILTVNHYRRTRASLCLVLPPVGNARTAIWLLECLEAAIGSKLFNNRQIQIQVCSPGRLNARYAALLSVGFYLGSDFLRRYTLDDFETTFSHINSRDFRRGRRLVIYDANGMFDQDFEWWGRGSGRVIFPQLPVENERSDILTCTSRRDVENVNLLATLLVHAQYGGYWEALGKQFAQEMHELLGAHLMGGLLDAPWIVTSDWQEGDDEQFFSAFQELMAYAFDEAARLRKASQSFWRKQQAHQTGILWEMRNLLQKYRTELVRQSNELDRGEPS